MRTTPFSLPLGALLLALAACGGAATPASSSAPPVSATASGKPAVSASAPVSAAASAKPAASAAASAKPSALTVVRMGPPSVDLNYQLPFVVAKAKGYFQSEGIDAQMNLVAGNVAVPALLKGEIDLTNHGAAMQATMQGAGSMKSIYFPYNTSTLNLTVNTAKIKQPSDLIGQPVAVDTLGNSQDLGTRAILKSLGVDPQKVDIRPIQNSNNRVAAMISGQVVASADNPSLVAQELAHGGFKVLASSAQVFRIPWSGYAATSQYIADHHATLLGWERAMVKALVFVRQNPDETVDIVNQQTGLDKEIAKQALPLLLDVMDPNDPGGFTEEAMRNQIEMTKQNIPNARDASIDEVADAGPVREAQKSLGIHCKGGYKC
ncbi:MAG TPA: ABC transporter substrate-binding protein [Chloroflexota bacterium]